MSRQLRATDARIIELDYQDESTIAAAAQAYGSASLDVLVNCAGGSVLEETRGRRR